MSDQESGMFLSPAELADLPTDAMEKVEAITAPWRSFREATKDDIMPHSLDYLRWYVLARKITEIHRGEFDAATVAPLGEDMGANINTTSALLDNICETARRKLVQRRAVKIADNFDAEIAAAMGRHEGYVFSDVDYSRILKLITELHELIQKCEDITPEHKQRLHKDLDRFQASLHKVVSDVHLGFGFIVEASAVLGKCGENVKPVVDRLRELVDIFARSSQGLLPEMLSNALPFLGQQRQLPASTQESKPQPAESVDAQSTK